MRQFINILNESPLGDITVIGEPQPNKNGEWKTQHKLGPDGYAKGDKQLLTSPKSVAKIRDAFSHTPFLFDFYVFMDGMAKDLPWSKSNLEKRLGHDIDTNGKITIVYSHNATNTSPGSYMPMNAWALAHRFTHGLQINHDKEAVFRQSEFDVWEAFCSIWNVAFKKQYGEFNAKSDLFTKVTGPAGERTMMQFINMICTMRSARNHKINNSLDVFGELMAQYLLTGRVKLRKTADWDLTYISDLRTYAGERHSHRVYGALGKIDTAVEPEIIDATIDAALAAMETSITNLLNDMVGGVYGW